MSISYIGCKEIFKNESGKWMAICEYNDTGIVKTIELTFVTEPDLTDVNIVATSYINDLYMDEE